MEQQQNELSGPLAAQMLGLLGALEDKVTEHMLGEEAGKAELRNSINELAAKVDSFMLAFPGKDFRSHCEYHQLLIDAARARKDSWQKVRYDLMRYGVIGFLIWTGYAMWKAFLLGPK